MRPRLVVVFSTPRSGAGIAIVGVILAIVLASLAVYVLMRVLPPAAEVWALIGMTAAIVPAALAASALLATRIEVKENTVEVQARGLLFGKRTLQRQDIVSTEVAGDPVTLTFVVRDGTRLTVGPWEDPFPWSERVRKERLAQLQEALGDTPER